MSFRNFLCEFLSTLHLVTLTCVACCHFESSTLPLAITCAVIQSLVIFLFRPVAEVYANPAVSLALWMHGALKFKRLLTYIIAEIFGGIMGHFIAYKILGKFPNDELCIFLPKSNLSNQNIMGIEFILTFLVIMMWCILWDYNGILPKEFYIAVVHVLVNLLGGNLTGAPTNPARTLAPVLFTKRLNKSQFLVAGQFLAGFLTPCLWKCLDQKLKV